MAAMLYRNRAAEQDAPPSLNPFSGPAGGGHGYAPPGNAGSVLVSTHNTALAPLITNAGRLSLYERAVDVSVKYDQLGHSFAQEHPLFLSLAGVALILLALAIVKRLSTVRLFQ